MTRCALFAILTLLTPLAFRDLDVELDPGRPFDYIKSPRETPTGGGRADTESDSGQAPPPGHKPGETVAEEGEKKKKKDPPPPPPSGLPGPKAPSTIDWAQHLPWKPKDDLVEWKDPMGGQPPPTATGEKRGEPPKGADVWDLKNYPPKVSNELYVYCITRFLQVMLHKAQVSEFELTQMLIDLDYPAYYAASAVKTDSTLRNMGTAISLAVGPMVKNPPSKPEGELRQRVYMDLLLHYPYEPGFGEFILSRPSGETMPILLEILAKEKHPFLLRNAVFILRCFNNIEVVEPLYKLLTTTADPVLRNRALIALTRWGHPGAAKWCGQRLKGADTFRTLAIWAIGRIAVVSPVDQETIDRVVAASREVDVYGEFLLSAVPALGQIGRGKDDAVKKKIESALKDFRRLVPAIKNPSCQTATGAGMVPNPDPEGVRGKIIEERLRMAQALLGDAAEIKWVEGARGSVHITNRVLLDETLELLKK